MRFFSVVSLLTLVAGLSTAHAASPVWTVRDIDQFQDNFASDGTLTGFVRADMANDILPDSSPGILPGDSCVVVVADPVDGLAIDGVLGGKAVYCYVLVQPFSQPSKTGAALSGGSRWPLAGTEVIGGHTWTKLRLDQSDLGGGPVPDNYCVDLNDSLFTPGDTIFFFYAAKSNDVSGTTTYFSLETGTVSDINLAAALPMEMTCLPAGGFNRGGDILYVDSAEDEVQAYWDSVFRINGFYKSVDRFDVRGAADGGNNRPSSRVVNVAGQFNAAYAVLWWDCGSLPITLGDGSGTPQKTDEYNLLNTFFGNLTIYGGGVFFGDDVAEQLAASSAPAATAFKSVYMPFTLVSGDHASSYGLAPAMIRWPGRCVSDNFMTYAVGPPVKDFDIMQPFGSSRTEVTYGPNALNNAAVLSNNVHFGPVTSAISMCGFSFADVRDDDKNGISDRAQFLKDISNGCGGVSPFPPVTPVGPVHDNELLQNHPNPFNPQTTISFSIAQRAHVQLAIYDVNGALVRTLANDTRAAGAYDVTWDGRDQSGKQVASGVYFYKLNAGSFTQTKKMVLLK